MYLVRSTFRSVISGCGKRTPILVYHWMTNVQELPLPQFVASNTLSSVLVETTMKVCIATVQESPLRDHMNVYCTQTIRASADLKMEGNH